MEAADMTEAKRKIEHLVRAAILVLGIKWSSATLAALEEYEVAQDWSAEATRRIREAQEARRKFLADERQVNIETALNGPPKDFVFCQDTSDVERDRAIAGVYAAAAAQKQVAIEASIDRPRARAQIEAALLKIASAEDPTQLSVVEFAAAQARTAQALQVACDLTLYLGRSEGMTEQESKLIRAARSNGILMSLQSARDVISGKTPERTAAETRAADKARETRQKLAEEAAVTAKVRRGGSFPPAG